MGSVYLFRNFISHKEMRLIESIHNIIVSPSINCNTDQTIHFSTQIRFYLFGNGPDVGTLNIYTRTTNGGALNLVRSLANFAIDSFTFIEEFLIVLDNFQVSSVIWLLGDSGLRV